MVLKSNFEIIDIADEYMAIPVGERANDFGGIIALSETAAFLLNCMKSPKSEDELVSLLTNTYEISEKDAIVAIRKAISDFIRLGILDT